MISIVVPCFNEEQTIPYFYREMERIMTRLGEAVEYIFVDDGSSDRTLAVLNA